MEPRRDATAAAAAAVGVATSAPPLLRLDKVSKRFGGLSVLEDVSFEVPKGSVFGLIGPNGAGKTTVFNLVTGLLAPTGGSIALGGTSLVGVKPHRITRLGISRTFQNIRIFKEMTLLENVVVGMHTHLGYGVPQLAVLPARLSRGGKEGTRARARSCCRGSDSSARRATSPTSSPTATSASSSWPAPWPPSRRCCCSTSPWPA